MTDIELVIKIPEEVKAVIDKKGTNEIVIETIWQAVKNGTPLDTHDEEIIATTVESIWGKPPYTDMLDNLRAEMLQIIDKYRNEVSK